jgi:hypothetical protein
VFEALLPDAGGKSKLPDCSKRRGSILSKKEYSQVGGGMVGDGSWVECKGSQEHTMVDKEDRLVINNGTKAECAGHGFWGGRQRQRWMRPRGTLISVKGK